MLTFSTHSVSRLVISLSVLCLLLASCGSPNSATVSAPHTLVIVAPSSLIVGNKGNLSTHLDSADGRDVTDQTIWRSSTPSVVNLTSPAAFSAQSSGAVTITAIYEEITATATVTVTDHFAVISIPDTQRMTAQVTGGSFDMMSSEFNWIKDHQVSENILMVAGEGDIVNDGNVLQEWSAADSMYKVLDAAAIPYAPAIGNHDYDIGGGAVGADRASHNYNQYFGPQRFKGRSWYGQTTFPAGQGDNFYVTFDAGTQHYMVLELEFLPRPEAIPWAQSVIDAHPDYQVILLTHGYLNPDGSRISQNDYSGTGFSYWGLSPANASDGNQLWAELISANPNIISVLCGHTQGIQVSRDDDDNVGNPVSQIKADFEDDGRGGSGMLRIMQFYPAQNRIDVSSYSPYFDQWLTDISNQFTLFYGKPAN
jgi:Calcineurin-like phosphoesterase